MAAWSETKLTKKGLALQAKLAEGAALTFTKAMAGAGKVPVVALEEQTRVLTPKQTVAIESVTMIGSAARLSVRLSNNRLATPYTVHQLGIYVLDPDEGEILYCIAQNEEGEMIPSAQQAERFSVLWDFTVLYGNAGSLKINCGDNLWITYDTAVAMFANKTEFNDTWQALLEAMDTSQFMTLQGTVDPTEFTEGHVGQFYINTETGALFFCQKVSDAVYTWRSVGNEPVFPQIFVTTPEGATVTCTKGGLTLTAESTGIVLFEVPEYGEWTIGAVSNGDQIGVRTIAVNAVKQYITALPAFLANLTVTAVSGAKVIAAKGAGAYTGICGENGKCTIAVPEPGTYTVHAVIDDVVSKAVAVDVAETGRDYAAAVDFITLTVTVDSGSAVTVTDGSKTYAQASAGETLFYLPHTGIWTVTAVLSGETADDEIIITSHAAYAVSLSYTKIFGVVWDYGDSRTTLTRLGKENDPHHFATVNIKTEPVAAVGTGAGSSPFDRYMPWAGMQEYNIIDDEVRYVRGDIEFSRSRYDTMIKIPEFYFKIIDDAENEKRYFYVSDRAHVGFSLHPGSGRYVGKYLNNAQYTSKTATEPIRVTRTVARTAVKKRGTSWSLFDLVTCNAIQLLYIVEFADWDSQTKLGFGQLNYQNTGNTDHMQYHTGREVDTSTLLSAIQYRGIENFWCQTASSIDGVNRKGTSLYISANPADYKESSNVNYFEIPDIAQYYYNAGFISKLYFNKDLEWLLWPSETSGSSRTYIPDSISIDNSTEWCGTYLGGWNGGWQDGMMSYRIGKTDAAVGSRLIFIP